MSQFVPPPPPAGVVVPLPTPTPTPTPTPAAPQEVTAKPNSVAFDIDLGGFGKKRAGSPKPAPNFSFLRREPGNKLTRASSGDQLDALMKERRQTTSPLSLSLTAGKADKKDATLSVLKSLDSGVGLPSAHHPTLSFAQVTGVALKPSVAQRVSGDTLSSSVGGNAATNESVRLSSANVVESGAPIQGVSPSAPAGPPSAPTAPPTPTTTTTTAAPATATASAATPMPQSMILPTTVPPSVPLPTSTPSLTIPAPTLTIAPSGMASSLPQPQPTVLPDSVPALNSAPPPLAGSTLLPNTASNPLPPLPSAALQSSTSGQTPGPSTTTDLPLQPAPPVPSAPSPADLASMVPLTGALLEKAIDAFQGPTSYANGGAANAFYYPYHRLVAPYSSNSSAGYVDMGAFTTTAISLLAPTSQLSAQQHHQSVSESQRPHVNSWDATFTVSQHGRTREYNPTADVDWRLNPVSRTGYTSSTTYHATTTQSREHCRDAASIAQSRYAERAARYATSSSSSNSGSSNAQVNEGGSTLTMGHGKESPVSAADRHSLPPAPPAATSSAERSVSPVAHATLSGSDSETPAPGVAASSEGQGPTANEGADKSTYSVVRDPRTWKLRVAGDSTAAMHNAPCPFPSLAPESYRLSDAMDFTRAETVYVFSGNCGSHDGNTRTVTTSSLLSEPLLKSSVMNPIHATSTDIWNAALQAAEQQCKAGPEKESDGAGTAGESNGINVDDGEAKGKAALHTGLVDRLRVLWGTKVVDERTSSKDGAEHVSDDAPSLRTRVRPPGKSEPVVSCLSPAAQLLAAAILYARGEGHFPRLLGVHRLTASGASTADEAAVQNHRVRPEECLELKFLKPDVQLRVTSEALEKETVERGELAGVNADDTSASSGMRALDRRATAASGMSRRSLYSRRGSLRSDGGVAGYKTMLAERKEKSGYADGLTTQSTGLSSHGVMPAIRSDEDVISVVVRAIVADRHVLHDAGKQVVVHTLPHLQDDVQLSTQDTGADNGGGNSLRRTAPSPANRRRPRDRIPVLSPTAPTSDADAPVGAQKTSLGSQSQRILNDLSTCNRFGDLTIVFVMPHGKSQLTAMPPTPTELAMLRYGIFSLQGYDPLSRVPITTVTNKSGTTDKKQTKKGESNSTVNNDYYSTLVTRSGGLNNGSALQRATDGTVKGALSLGGARSGISPVPVGSTFTDARDVAGITCASRTRSGDNDAAQKGFASRRARSASIRPSAVHRSAPGNSGESAFESFMLSARNVASSTPKPTAIPPYVPQNISEETLQRYLREEEMSALRSRRGKTSTHVKLHPAAGARDPKTPKRSSSNGKAVHSIQTGGVEEGSILPMQKETLASGTKHRKLEGSDEFCNETFRPSDVKRQPKPPSRKPSSASINSRLNRAASASMQKSSTRVLPVTRSSSRISLFSEPLMSHFSTETSESEVLADNAIIQQPRATSHDTRPPRPQSRMISREGSIASIVQASGVFESSLLHEGRARLNKPVSRTGSFSLDLGSISRSLRPVATFTDQTAAQEAVAAEYGGEQYQSAIFGMPITQAPAGSGIFYNMSATQAALPEHVHRKKQQKQEAPSKTHERQRSNGAGAPKATPGAWNAPGNGAAAGEDDRLEASSPSFPFHTVDLKLFAKELQRSADCSFYERVDPLASITAGASYRL